MAAAIALLLAVAVAAAGAAGSEEIEAQRNDPPDVVWAVQLSDLHVSVYHPGRAQDLELVASRALALVRPHLVLVSGDLTDAKNRELTVTRQDQAEWVQYQRSMQLVVERSGLAKRAFFDLRGNHDKFGVPHVNSHLDFFSRFSMSAEMNRTDTVQTVIVTANGGRKYVFLGFDDTATIGLRGPTNLFGHPTDSMLERIDKELAKHQAPTVVFGHFPMSFTTATESGKRLEDLLSRHSVLAYVCGHLHTKFGQQLYRFHSPTSSSRGGSGGFWEWEMGDWRGQRAMRILALDQGLASFADFSLRANHTAFIVQTYPLDSRFMTKTGRSAAVGDSVRVLVFSEAPVAEVVASVYDSQPGSQILADELVMQPDSSSSVLYQAPWSPSKYSGASPLRYWIEIRVTDTLGRQIRSQLRPFSVDGSGAPWRLGLWGFLVMGVQWDAAYPVLFWLSMGLLATLLVLPKLLPTHHLEEAAAWSTVKLPLWILAEGSRHAGLWWAQVVYLAYLLLFPWFWGRPSAETYPSGYMTYRGWQFQGQVLAVPDVLVIVLPFCYLVLLPLAALISLMSAERALVRSHTCPAPADKQVGSRAGLLHLLDQQQQQQGRQCRVCARWMRKLLLLACAAVAWLHWRQCYWVAAAYGPMAVLASPAFAWWPPLVMAFGVYETWSVGRRRREKSSQ